MFPQPRKIWPWILTIVAVLFLVQAPEAAASLVSGAAHLLSTAADSVGAFVQAL